ncbi:sn-glycerol-3-phosphate ABC transporter substrate-binding protein UgpB [Chachezhania antarctica]|uniref:sn-glycerol-3-phosphate ABC transporter substrate-binding protein UgpB n=1 Tax=Chachezhania antarctica TaxID=2340860 RepID=UPI000EAB5040|nr:sn-glycerol-3-phosphate ABC transporter substrate-binding protein UgpB [Chachezhania antarctica]
MKSFALAAVASVAFAGTASAQTEITWWHAMGGALGEKVEEIAKGFNESQSDYKINAVYKGGYAETMTAAVAAFRANQQPHIVQVFEVGTATMMAADGAIYPVYQMMEDAGEPFDQSAYLPSVISYYVNDDNQLLSMPFNSSTPIVYYNVDLLEKAGVDTSEMPKTWDELAAVAKQVVDSGAAECGFTTTWQSWIQLENQAAWHDVAFASANDGYAGTDVELLINDGVPLRHIENMAEWAKDGTFKYGGRQSSGNPMFFSGECAITMGSSAGRAGVMSNMPDTKIAYGMLPYYDDVQGAPQNSIIGGATLWVLQGHEQPEYKGVAEFFSYLSSPEVQADWHQFTGYLPITNAAYELSKEQGYYEKNPGAELPIKQMTLNDPTVNSRGLRLGNFVQIRDVINEELENVWSGQATPKEALDQAVARGNDLLNQFDASN